MKQHKTKWYKLDTSAKIYPALESERNPALFRVSMSLKKDVVPQVLLEALKSIKERFPYYNVHLKKGLFWNYLEQNDNELKIWQDHPAPCEKIYTVLNNGYLYKVKYYKKKISLDIFHVLTDGYGAMEFLKTLVAQYLFLSGEISKVQNGILLPDEVPPKEEEEDAFLKVLELEKDNKKNDQERTLFNESKNYQIKDRYLPAYKYKIITGILSVDEMKDLAKKYNATITHILAALYIEAGIYLQASKVKDKKKHKSVALQVPVNMRKYYAYNCMRNFTLFVIPTIDPRKVTCFKDIVCQVKKQMDEQLDKSCLLAMVRENCALATNLIIKHVPIDIKNFFIRLINNTKSASRFVGTISNLGVVSLPEQMAAAVDEVSFLIGKSHNVKCSCGVTGYNNKIYISFGRSMKNPYIERHIFTSLVKMGIKVKLKSNY